MHGVGDVAGERVDGDERRDAERDRRHVQHQTPADGARVTPRERGELSPRHAHAASASEIDGAIAQPHDAPGAAGERLIVRHEHDRRAVFAVERLEQLDDPAARRCIEVAGGLVGEEDLRANWRTRARSRRAAARRRTAASGSDASARPSPTRARSSRARSAALRSPRSSSGTCTFSSAVSVGIS